MREMRFWKLSRQNDEAIGLLVSGEADEASFCRRETGRMLILASPVVHDPGKYHMNRVRK